MAAPHFQPANSYTMTAADAKNCQETYTAQLTIPASSNPAKRKLSGVWGRLTDDQTARNIQFHAIAVDAGGPVATGGGAETPCTHNTPSSNAGSVTLQAAVLAEPALVPAPVSHKSRYGFDLI